MLGLNEDGMRVSDASDLGLMDEYFLSGHTDEAVMFSPKEQQQLFDIESNWRHQTALSNGIDFSDWD